MQNPTSQAETSIPTEYVINGPNLNRTVTVRRKAAKRSESWYQNIVATLSTPARKKPRLEEPLLLLPTTTDEAAGKAASPDTSVGLPPLMMMMIQMQIIYEYAQEEARQGAQDRLDCNCRARSGSNE